MPIISGGGGAAYVPPTARQGLTGNNVTVADGANATLTWDTSLGPDALLDLTDPAHPAILTAGIYAVTVIIGVSALTANGSYFGSLELAGNSDDFAAQTDSTLGTAAVPAPHLSLSCTAYIGAGDVIVVTVRNHDGAASRDLALAFGSVQRVT